MTSTSDGASYTYDAMGNTKTRTLPSGEQTLDWDYSNRLKSVSAPEGTTSYVYDADGNQLIRRDPDKTTLFMPSQEFVRNHESGIVTGTRYYSHGGTKVGMRVGGGNYKVEVSDLHNTGQLVVDSVSRDVTRRAVDPFGNVLGEVVGGPWPSGRGFLDKPVSAVTGLTDIGARKYDAMTGRFISVDPLLDLSAPQTWTGYNYANNNPTTFADPTGLFCDGCEYSGSGDNHGVGCSYDTSGGCRSKEEVDLGYQIETGQNENAELQPELFGVRVPTYKMLKGMRPAGYGYGPGDTYAGAVRDWARNRCVRAGEADRDFCNAARSYGMLDPKNPTLHKLIGAIVLGGIAAVVCVGLCLAATTAAAAFTPEAAVMTSALISAEAMASGATAVGVGAAVAGAAAKGLPGAAGTQVAGRLSTAEMAALHEANGVEFALMYRTGPGTNGGGGTYWLYSGESKKVSIPLGPDWRMIYHTHPGYGDWASRADMNITNSLMARAGSPQRSSQIVMSSGDTIRFGGKWTNVGHFNP